MCGALLLCVGRAVSSSFLSSFFLFLIMCGMWTFREDAGRYLHWTANVRAGYCVVSRDASAHLHPGEWGLLLLCAGETKSLGDYPVAASCDGSGPGGEIADHFGGSVSKTVATVPHDPVPESLLWESYSSAPLPH